jgi:hypothetical protein
LCPRLKHSDPLPSIGKHPFYLLLLGFITCAFRKREALSLQERNSMLIFKFKQDRSRLALGLDLLMRLKPAQPEKIALIWRRPWVELGAWFFRFLPLSNLPLRRTALRIKYFSSR